MKFPQKVSLTSLIFPLTITMLFSIMITFFFVSITREPIKQIKIKKHAELIQKLIPQTNGNKTYDNDLLKDKIEITALRFSGANNSISVYRARKNEQAVGLIMLPITLNGYNGAIKLAMSLDSHGKILIINILDHKETPEFGDAIHQDNSNWLKSFTGKTSIDLTKESDIDQISGASVSSTAVTTAIIKCLNYYQKEKDQLWQ